jgi:hypothetical protein
MSAGWAAPLAGVCTILASVAPAHADERRRVAVIDLSADPEAKDLRDALYRELLGHWALQPLDRPALDAALQGEFLDEDRDALVRAAGKRGDAEAALARFDFQVAAALALEGEGALVTTTPIHAAGPCGDLAFVAAIAQLDLHHGNDASVAFAFAHRLDPARKPDPVRYPPEILQAYQSAATTHPSPVHVEVRGTGRVWIDGIERGTAPGTFDVDSGLHLVQLAAPDRVTAGRVVDLDRDQPLEIATASAPEELRIARARRMLAQLPDDAIARAGAMKQLAALLQVHDAVLIWMRKEDGKLLVQTWRDRAPGFSALREHASEPAGDLLAPLAPPKPPEVEGPVVPPIRVPKEEEPVWYQRRWVQASAAGGVVLTVIGAILWARRSHDVMVGTNTQFVTVPP